MHYLYILYSPSHDKFYVGESQDFRKRLLKHNESPFHSYTKKYRPWELYTVFECEDRSQGRSCEAFIKKQKSKAFIRNLKTMELHQAPLNTLKRINTVG